MMTNSAISHHSFVRTGIEGLLLIESRLFPDSRGSFCEIYRESVFKEAGISKPFVQMNQSVSHFGVLRGLHFQKKFPQGKYIRAARGSIFDVAVDLRPGSKTFGKWKGFVLSEENRASLYVPRGFAHGFLALAENTCVTYFCDEYYHPEDEGGILWNDPDLDIRWPHLGPEAPSPILSAKDAALPGFKRFLEDPPGWR